MKYWLINLCVVPAAITEKMMSLSCNFFEQNRQVTADIIAVAIAQFDIKTCVSRLFKIVHLIKCI